MKFITGAVLLCLASAASAQTAPTLVGGGATLPELGYTGSSVGSTKVTPASGSLFGAYAAAGGNTSSYCAIGSGAGKKVLANNDATVGVNVACGSGGFGGTSLTQPHYAASDAPLSQSEYTAYTNGHAGGSKPVQLPSIAGAVGIVFKKSGVTSLNLTEAQVCGIFSGQITTWNDAALASALPSGVSATGNINIVFRADNSGTSFAFLNHLSKVCPANVASGKVAATQFKTTQSYSTGAAAYTYASSVGATGNAAVVSSVSTGVDGSIGYAEAANSIGVSGVRQASVKNSHVTGNTFISPLTGFGTTAVPVTLSYDKVIDSFDTNGRPTYLPLSSTTQCVAVADADGYADPQSGYPIVAVTYLLGNTSGNSSNGGTALSGVRGLLGSPYNTSLRSSVTRIGRANTGYAFLSSTDLTQAKVDGCILN